jgi:antitoxin component of MazEF toxin-antitoxin module
MSKVDTVLTTIMDICKHMFMREFVKVRLVAGSLVVSLPQSVLEPVGLKEGDRVILEAAPPRRLILTKEGMTMTSTQHLEMEIDLLERKKTAIESDLSYKQYQHNSNMPCDEGMSDNDVAILVMSALIRDRDRLDVEIAEKRIQLYEIQAGEDSRTSGVAGKNEPLADKHPKVNAPVDSKPATFAPASKPKTGWYLWKDQDNREHILAFVNAKGSSSLRPFDARNGNALKRSANRKGDYQDAFAEYLVNSIPLQLTRQPNLEHDCKKRLPASVFTELQQQIKSS